MRLSHGLGILLIALIPATAYAYDVTCPPSISVKQLLPETEPGWTARVDTINKPMVLESIELYDGPPEELASLKPDNGDSEDEVMVWTLPPSSRGYYVECRYANTAVTFSQKLPIEPRECHLTYEKQVRVSGLPAVQSMVCD